MMIRTRGSPFQLWLITLMGLIMCSSVSSEMDWVRVTTEYTPPSKDGHKMVYDTSNQISIMFGGYAYKDRSPPLYEYDGINWMVIEASEGWPPARAHFGMAYDASRNVVVVFGGFQGGFDYLGDTWEWDGTQWEEKFPEHSPMDRIHHSMTYFDAEGVTYLFAGYTEASERTSELWIWDGIDWSDRTQALGPSPRSESPIIEDSFREKLIIWGGADTGYSATNDTWEWDGSQWEQIFTEHSPPDKRNHTLVFDQARGVAVLFGGNDDPYGLSRETWEYDGTDWTQIATDRRPVARTSHAACYDSARGRIVMYGGFSDSGSLNDTWEYYDVPTPTPSPTPTDTPSPTPTPTATPLVTGVMIEMPSHLFHPGDPCYCTATVTNAEPDPLVNHPLFVILDAYGVHFFAPSFTQTPGNYPGPWPAGTTDIEVIPAFSWPDTGTSASGLFFCAALTDPEVTKIVGEWDSWEFGWF